VNTLWTPTVVSLNKAVKKQDIQLRGNPAVRGKKPLTLQMLRELAHDISNSPTYSHEDLVRYTAALVAFTYLARSEQYTNTHNYEYHFSSEGARSLGLARRWLRHRDLQFEKHQVIIQTYKTKNNQLGAKHSVRITKTNNSNQYLCPFEMLLQLHSWKQQQPYYHPEMPVFGFDPSKIDNVAGDSKYDKYVLQYEQQLKWIQRKLDSLGYVGSSFGTHSFRKGGATSLGQSGATQEQVMEALRNKSSKTLQRYVHTNVTFTNNTTAAILSHQQLLPN
jgi:hypothetical protein